MWSERAVKLSNFQSRCVRTFKAFIKVSNSSCWSVVKRVSDFELSNSYCFQTSNSELSGRVKLSISRTSQTLKLRRRSNSPTSNPLKLSNSRPGPAVFALSSGIGLQTFELALASNLRARNSFKLLNFKLSTSVSFIVFILQAVKLSNSKVFNGHSSLQTLKCSSLKRVLVTPIKNVVGSGLEDLEAWSFSCRNLPGSRRVVLGAQDTGCEAY